MNVFDDLIDELEAVALLEANEVRRDSFSETQVDSSSETDEILRELAELEKLGDAEPAKPDGAFDAYSNSGMPGMPDPEGENEFFRKRALDEVSSLQLVEHVISAIEREHNRLAPAAFDELPVKKALHQFLQVTGPNSPSSAECEFQLLQETGRWAAALGERDGRISVANLRRFCERSRPALSSQALMALARFYRNSAFSEEARSKFEVVMTRLFARETEDDKRHLLFTREEMPGHIKVLYANWSSVPLYSMTEDEEYVQLAASRFEDLIIEVESAETFDELLEVNFFERVAAFKESTAEMFYVPEVCAAGIICNVRIGNKYVELIHEEKERTKTASVEQRYGYTYDQLISDAAGKTLLLVNLLKTKQSGSDGQQIKSSFDEVFPEKVKAAPEGVRIGPRATFDMFGVNKWLLGAAMLLIAVSIAIHFWAENASSGEGAVNVAAEVEVSDPELREHIRAARNSGETLYGIVNPTWDSLSEEKKQEFIAKVYKFGSGKGYRRVTLVNARGRTVGFASAEKFEIIKP